ncbi:SGNH/GDSL hydrolase family protein, partial [Streptomyces tricolor]
MTGGFGRCCRIAAALLTAAACQSAPAARADAPPGSTARATGVVTWAASADRLGEGTAGQGYRLVVRT